MNEHFQEKLLEEVQKRFSVIPGERDTHFTNAAKLLVDKLMATNAMDTLDADRFLDNDDLTELQMLFAQFTYDVVYHTILHVNPYHLDALAYEEIPARIPDFTPQTPGSSPEPGP